MRAGGRGGEAAASPRLTERQGEASFVRIRVGGTADVFILGVVEGLAAGAFSAYRLTRLLQPNKKRIWADFPFYFNG